MPSASSIVILLLLQTAASTKMKFARKAHTDKKVEVDGEERKRSTDIEALNTQGLSTDAMASQEPPLMFEIAQELTFSMLTHAL